MGGRSFSNKYNKMKKTFRNKHKKAKQKHNITYKNKNFKKLNCSPSVEGKTQVKDSCIPDDILIQIRNEYNKDHPENQIISTHLNEIWYELKHRLQCKSEKCWLNELDNEDLKKKLEKTIFAPDSIMVFLSNSFSSSVESLNRSACTPAIVALGYFCCINADNFFNVCAVLPYRNTGMQWRSACCNILSIRVGPYTRSSISAL